MALNSLTDKMSEQIDYVVTRRQQNCDYIKRAHQGKVHWLGVIKLSKASIIANFPPDKLQKRIRRWYLLGLSLGRLLDFGSGAVLVRALAQLLEEYEHYIGAKRDMYGGSSSARPFGGGDNANNAAHAAVAAAAAQLTAGEVSTPGQGQGSQLLLAPLLFIGSAHCSAHVQATAASAAHSAAAHSGSAITASSLSQSLSRSSNHGGGGGGDSHSSGGGGGGGSSSSSSFDHKDSSFKPTLHKGARGQVLYAYLSAGAATGMDAVHLDYCEIVTSLCDVLTLIYAKFLHPECAPPSAVHTAVLRIDRKLRALILAKLAQDLASDVAQPLLKQELTGLLNHMFWDERAGQQQQQQQQYGQATRRFIQLDENAALGEVDDGLDDHDDEDR